MVMALIDPRTDMSIEELMDELTLRFPEEVVNIEREHEDAFHALEWEDDCDPELLEALRE